MSQGFFSNALTSRPQLWRAMLRANPRPALENEAVNAALAEYFEGAEAARLRAWLQSSPLALGVRQFSSFWDFGEESRRLALLGEAELTALARVTGVALHAPDIARVLRREDQTALREALGENLYRYALYRGQYQLGSVRRLFAERDHHLPLAERCVLHGRLALRLVAASWPQELEQPFCARIEGLFLEPLSGECVLTAGETREIWLALKKLLIKEVEPSWAPCFD